MNATKATHFPDELTLADLDGQLRRYNLMWYFTHTGPAADENARSIEQLSMNGRPLKGGAYGPVAKAPTILSVQRYAA